MVLGRSALGDFPKKLLGALPLEIRQISAFVRETVKGGTLADINGLAPLDGNEQSTG